MANSLSKLDKTIVFFDSECILCSRCVSFIFTHRNNRTNKLYYAPIGGETYRAVLSSCSSEKQFPNSLIYLSSEGDAFTRWQAVMHIAEHLTDPPHRLVTFLDILPLSTLNAIYSVVAWSRRYLSFTLKLASPDACSFRNKQDMLEHVLP